MRDKKNQHVTAYCNCESCQNQRFTSFNRCIIWYLKKQLAEYSGININKISGAVIFENYYLFTDGERLFHFDSELDPSRIKDHPEEFETFFKYKTPADFGNFMINILLKNNFNCYEMSDKEFDGSCICGSDKFVISRTELINLIITSHKNIWAL